MGRRCDGLDFWVDGARRSFKLVPSAAGWSHNGLGSVSEYTSCVVTSFRLRGSFMGQRRCDGARYHLPNQTTNFTVLSPPELDPLLTLHGLTISTYQPLFTMHLQYQHRPVPLDILSLTPLDFHIFKYLNPTRPFALKENLAYEEQRRRMEYLLLKKRHAERTRNSGLGEGMLPMPQWEWWQEDEWREEWMRKLDRRRMGPKL